MGPGFGNTTLSNRHKITLSVNGKLGSFGFQRFAARCTFVCWWSRLHLKARKLASNTDFKDRKLLPFAAVSKN